MSETADCIHKEDIINSLCSDIAALQTELRNAQFRICELASELMVERELNQQLGSCPGSMEEQSSLRVIRWNLRENENDSFTPGSQTSPLQSSISEVEEENFRVEEDYENQSEHVKQLWRTLILELKAKERRIQSLENEKSAMEVALNSLTSPRLVLLEEATELARARSLKEEQLIEAQSRCASLELLLEQKDSTACSQFRELSCGIKTVIEIPSVREEDTFDAVKCAVAAIVNETQSLKLKVQELEDARMMSGNEFCFTPPSKKENQCDVESKNKEWLSTNSPPEMLELIQELIADTIYQGVESDLTMYGYQSDLQSVKVALEDKTVAYDEALLAIDKGKRDSENVLSNLADRLTELYFHHGVVSDLNLYYYQNRIEVLEEESTAVKKLMQEGDLERIGLIAELEAQSQSHMQKRIELTEAIDQVKDEYEKLEREMEEQRSIMLSRQEETSRNHALEIEEIKLIAEKAKKSSEEALTNLSADLTELYIHNGVILDLKAWSFRNHIEILKVQSMTARKHVEEGNRQRTRLLEKLDAQNLTHMQQLSEFKESINREQKTCEQRKLAMEEQRIEMMSGIEAQDLMCAEFTELYILHGVTLDLQILKSQSDIENLEDELGKCYLDFKKMENELEKERIGSIAKLKEQSQVHNQEMEVMRIRSTQTEKDSKKAISDLAGELTELHIYHGVINDLDKYASEIHVKALKDELEKKSMDIKKIENEVERERIGSIALLEEYCQTHEQEMEDMRLRARQIEIDSEKSLSNLAAELTELHIYQGVISDLDVYASEIRIKVLEEDLKIKLKAEKDHVHETEQLQSDITAELVFQDDMHEEEKKENILPNEQGALSSHIAELIELFIHHGVNSDLKAYWSRNDTQNLMNVLQEVEQVRTGLTERLEEESKMHVKDVAKLRKAKEDSESALISFAAELSELYLHHGVIFDLKAHVSQNHIESLQEELERKLVDIGMLNQEVDRGRNECAAKMSEQNQIHAQKEAELSEDAKQARVACSRMKIEMEEQRAAMMSKEEAYCRLEKELRSEAEKVKEDSEKSLSHFAAELLEFSIYHGVKSDLKLLACQNQCNALNEEFMVTRKLLLEGNNERAVEFSAKIEQANEAYKELKSEMEEQRIALMSRLEAEHQTQGEDAGATPPNLAAELTELYIQNGVISDLRIQVLEEELLKKSMAVKQSLQEAEARNLLIARLEEQNQRHAHEKEEARKPNRSPENMLPDCDAELAELIIYLGVISDLKVQSCQDDIEALQKELEHKSTTVSKAELEKKELIARLEAQHQLHEQQIDEIDGKLGKVQALLADSEREMSQITAELVEQVILLGVRSDLEIHGCQVVSSRLHASLDKQTSHCDMLQAQVNSLKLSMDSVEKSNRNLSAAQVELQQRHEFLLARNSALSEEASRHSIASLKSKAEMEAINGCLDVMLLKWTQRSGEYKVDKQGCSALEEFNVISFSASESAVEKKLKDLMAKVTGVESDRCRQIERLLKERAELTAEGEKQKSIVSALRSEIVRGKAESRAAHVREVEQQRIAARQMAERFALLWVHLHLGVENEKKKVHSLTEERNNLFDLTVRAYDGLMHYEPLMDRYPSLWHIFHQLEKIALPSRETHFLHSA